MNEQIRKMIELREQLQEDLLCALDLYDDNLKDIVCQIVVDRFKDFTTEVKEKKVNEDKYIVRVYDGFDNQWCDVSKAVTKEEADKIWNKYTGNGTHNTKFNDIDYYRIFPADTHMLYSNGFGERDH